MKVVIAGSRDIWDATVISDAIKVSNFLITEGVSGCASGVDSVAADILRQHGIPVKDFPAKWGDLEVEVVRVAYRGGQPYNVLAGFQRNERMADYADALIAVWDGTSKGTKHMIDCMVKRSKPYFVYSPPTIRV